MSVQMLKTYHSWIKHQYPGYTEVLITENGVSRRLGETIDLCDQQRVEFYRDYINNVLMSVRIDEVCFFNRNSFAILLS